MRRFLAGAWLFVFLLLPGRPGGRAETDAGIFLRLTPTSPVSFTNVLFHYVCFDAEVRNAEKLTVRLYNPEGKIAGFRNRWRVDHDEPARKSAGFEIAKGQEKVEDLNILFRSDSTPGLWTIEVTASAGGREPVTETLEVEVQPPRPLKLPMLAQVHEMIIGLDGHDALPIERGKIRYVAQDIRDPGYVKEYWYSKAYDLRASANQKCSRAVFSMALSYLEVDCTPVRMSEMYRAEELMDYTYDPICRKLGDVARVEGDLETLWKAYEAGEASPVLLHFKFDGGMHAVLLIARDKEDPELFYAVNSGKRVNLKEYQGGMAQDAVTPIIIENGRVGERIQSPILEKYNKAVIDQIWQWKLTDEH